MNLLNPRFAIDDFILKMLQVPPAQLQLDQLQEWVSCLELKEELFDRHVSFDPVTYQRKLICRTPRFDMLILCWQPGQCSTIHDHQASLNVTKVHRGQLTSRCFAPIEVAETASEKGATHSLFRPGSKPDCCSQTKITLHEESYLERSALALVDRHEIHQLANTSTENLVTLHVYARPLQEIAVYCPESGRVERIPVQYSPD
jgi:predicted metal-dependent enzyme (double-stranded beta helix superfamily)